MPSGQQLVPICCWPISGQTINQGLAYLEDAHGCRGTIRIPSAVEAQVKSSFFRGVASVLLVFVGGALSLFSIAVAFGWDYGPLSLAGTIIAILGLGLMFGGYWLIGNSDGAPVAAVCLKIALGFGSTFLIAGLLTVFARGEGDAPAGYFFAVGCLCVGAFVKFRAYTRDR
jgi:hypothetical protein